MSTFSDIFQKNSTSKPKTSWGSEPETVDYRGNTSVPFLLLIYLHYNQNELPRNNIYDRNLISKKITKTRFLLFVYHQASIMNNHDPTAIVMSESTTKMYK
jgi:hypothetical protein